MTTFLDVSAYLGEGFLHPGGQAATRVMMEYLDTGPGDQVLDIGCGTGATAALIAQTSRSQLVAVDRSPAMLAAATERIRAEGLAGSVHFMRADVTQGLPVADSVFAAVYAESVVALLEPELVLGECLRVLQPGGKLVLNERIWKPGVTQGLAKDINAVSQHAFGIPAATPQPLDRDGWESMLRGIGFMEIRATPTRELASKQSMPSRQSRFTRYSRHLRRPELIPKKLQYKRMIRRYASYWASLENYLFFAQKPE